MVPAQEPRTGRVGVAVSGPWRRPAPPAPPLPAPHLLRNPRPPRREEKPRKEQGKEEENGKTRGRKGRTAKGEPPSALRHSPVPRADDADAKRRHPAGCVPPAGLGWARLGWLVPSRPPAPPPPPGPAPGDAGGTGVSGRRPRGSAGSSRPRLRRMLCPGRSLLRGIQCPGRGNGGNGGTGAGSEMHGDRTCVGKEGSPALVLRWDLPAQRRPEGLGRVDNVAEAVAQAGLFGTMRGISKSHLPCTTKSNDLNPSVTLGT